MVHSERALDEITGEIVDAAYKLHTGLGPGLLESVYEVVLARELGRRGLRVARQEPVSFDYDGLHFRDCLRVDLLVESRVVVEIKSVEKLLPVHPRQLVDAPACRIADQFRRTNFTGGTSSDRQ